MMLILAVQIPQQTQVSSLSGEILSTLLLVGGVALLVVGYLALDWWNTRLEARKLAWRRQNAREAWQRARAEAND